MTTGGSLFHSSKYTNHREEEEGFAPNLDFDDTETAETTPNTSNLDIGSKPKRKYQRKPYKRQKGN